MLSIVRVSLGYTLTVNTSIGRCIYCERKMQLEGKHSQDIPLRGRGIFASGGQTHDSVAESYEAVRLLRTDRGVRLFASSLAKSNCTAERFKERAGDGDSGVGVCSSCLLSVRDGVLVSGEERMRVAGASWGILPSCIENMRVA